MRGRKRVFPLVKSEGTVMIVETQLEDLKTPSVPLSCYGIDNNTCALNNRTVGRVSLSVAIGEWLGYGK